jgi:UPF0716 protein FxsA
MRSPLLFMGWLPIVELVLLIAMGAAFGFLPTLAWVIGTAVVGIWLLRSAGPRAYQRAVQEAAAAGGQGAPVSIDALALFSTWFGAVLLILPGPITDLIGLVLVVPLLRRMTFGLWIAQRLRGVVVERSGAHVYEGEVVSSVYEGESRRSDDGRHIDHDHRS